jgi:hypothetical protein
MTILTGNAGPLLRLMGTPANGRVVVEGMTLKGGTTGVDTGVSDVLLSHLVIVQNIGDGVVGGQGGRIDARHLTVADNGGQGLALFGSAAIRNSIVSGNSGFGVSAPNGADVTYSDLFGNVLGSGVAGNLSVQVAYLNPAALDYRVAAGAATVDAGDPADPYSAEPAPNGGRVDQGAFGNTPDATPAFKAVSGSAVPTADAGGAAGCGLTGLEAIAALALLAAWRRRRRRAAAISPPGV